jgi:predicted RNase H-like HicB family nuclease/predicted RNA binding protein YcfA (HicA-like mRNA interferase family)
MKVRDLIKLIEQDGWYHVRTTGSYRHDYHATKTGTVTGPTRQRCSRRHSKQRDEAGRIEEMTQALKYAVVFERSEDGYGAFVPGLPGCITVGDTLEAEHNIREAITGHIAAMRVHGEKIPEPTTLTEYIEIPAAIAN